MKQEYEKKLFLLKSRLTQRASKDPSFWLFNQMASEGEKKSISVNSGANSLGNLSSSGGFWKQNSGRNFASGDRNSKALSSQDKNFFPGIQDSKGLKLSEKDRQYEFYLKSA